MMSLCKFLTGKTVDQLGGVLAAVTDAVHEALREGIEDGTYKLVTFDGEAMHLIPAGAVDPESSICSEYDSDVIEEIEVVVVQSGDGLDVELVYDDEPVIYELE